MPQNNIRVCLLEKLIKITLVMKYVSSEALADNIITKANADSHPTHALSRLRILHIIFTGLINVKIIRITQTLMTELQRVEMAKKTYFKESFDNIITVKLTATRKRTSLKGVFTPFDIIFVNSERYQLQTVPAMRCAYVNLL